MSLNLAILDAFLTRLQSFTTSSEILWPGVGGEPPSTGLWLEPKLFPNEPDNYSTGGTVQVYEGFGQILVGFRSGTGLVTPMEEAERLVAHYPKGTALGPVGVSERPYTRPEVANNDSSQWFIPVSIPYRGLT